MAIFQTETRTIGITDRMTLHGLDFEARLTVSEKNGNAAAIHRGRILSFWLLCDDETIAYYDDMTWYQLPDVNFEEGRLAMDILIRKWEKPENIQYYISEERKTE